MKEEVYFFDKDNRIVKTEEEASKVCIRLLDDEGKLISETFGNLNKENEPYEITQDEYNMLISQGYEVKYSEYKIIK